ncbi:hypothetical protein TSUD_211890 [Trifolium subterraneum]|uniref:Uncharacterized protein n=1 Tax=Trifolium subterraneum TaxID=3900 RepID=A0A2Z6N001_TRISU|nr:hypothetical protein TSUD_211890 [Trifolium subterraneum]
MEAPLSHPLGPGHHLFQHVSHPPPSFSLLLHCRLGSRHIMGLIVGGIVFGFDAGVYDLWTGCGRCGVGSGWEIQCWFWFPWF